MALRLGGCWSFLTDDLKDCVKLKIKDDVGDCQGTYPESLIKIRHDLAEKG
jgi:hypothetical protein